MRFADTLHSVRLTAQKERQFFKTQIEERVSYMNWGLTYTSGATLVTFNGDKALRRTN